MSQFIHYGIFLITIPNLVVVALMILLFGIAVVVNLPSEKIRIRSN